ncbi:hypothetical protein A9Q81_06350 [Gammaproteobacteria bacterium 42_54_T18]|nr:hypothetical protein A9Q81_06350 [Gammaproteobacteria bacterium 42_54_T18]
MITTSFQGLPSLASLYAKALFKRNQKRLTALPALTLKIGDVAINTAQFNQYLESFGFENDKTIPAPLR